MRFLKKEALFKKGRFEDVKSICERIEMIKKSYFVNFDYLCSRDEAADSKPSGGPLANPFRSGEEDRR